MDPEPSRAMPVWVPSLRGSMRMVATTRALPPAPGWTLTSPKGSTTFLSCMVGLRCSVRVGSRGGRDHPAPPSGVLRGLVQVHVGEVLAGLAELEVDLAPLGVLVLLGRGGRGGGGGGRLLRGGRGGRGGGRQAGVLGQWLVDAPAHHLE